MVDANVERFSGFAETYDRYRPQPPAVLLDILTRLAGAPRPRLVVDLGSGTGISTRLWTGRADEVVGVEPNADMRREAETHTQSPVEGTVIRYQEGRSTSTGLPDGCADIVTCSQSFHWMEPQPTLAEAARILRPGGVFATIDCDWPPVMTPEAELAYRRFMRKVEALEAERRVSVGVHKWPKEHHLKQIEASGRFRYTREVVAHGVETGDAARLVGLATSQGSVAALLKAGISEAEIGLDELCAEAARTLGDAPVPWYFGYRVRVGVR
ncbi:MAG: class I SAM-dependent methyltransferase [Armatimonadetes bacterium]|nr:class I SAM-dependent methyltransferase [Armatimonadota bacterium]